MTAPELRPVLSLTQLEWHDPEAPQGGRERRFVCPLPDARCAGKPRNAEHRSLSVNTETGMWTCHRCGNGGKLQEHWDPRPRDRRAQARAAVARAFSLRPSVEPRTDDDPDRLDGGWNATKNLEGTPGAAYLPHRGIPLEVAVAADVRWGPSWFGRPAVVFPIYQGDRLVAATGRYLDDRSPRFHTVGAKSEGVFIALPGALESPILALTEAAIDALSLAAAGVPSIALNGATCPSWLPPRLAFREVALALDADEAGDHAAEQMAVVLQSLGCRTERWRPPRKDWNQLLMDEGVERIRDVLAAIGNPD